MLIEKKNNYDAYSFKDVHINKYFMKSAQKKMKNIKVKVCVEATSDKD